MPANQSCLFYRCMVDGRMVLETTVPAAKALDPDYCKLIVPIRKEPLQEFLQELLDALPSFNDEDTPDQDHDTPQVAHDPVFIPEEADLATIEELVTKLPPVQQLHLISLMAEEVRDSLTRQKTSLKLLSKPDKPLLEAAE